MFERRHLREINKQLGIVLRVEFVIVGLVCLFLLVGQGVYALGLGRKQIDTADNFRAQKFTTAKDTKTTAVILAKLPTSPSTPSASSSVASIVWPLHGKVTTQFGAPDYPYQRVHTGIDISSGKPAGTMSVVAFKAGHVFQPQHMGGFGNVVAIDHGGGLTSYYGHLAAIKVSVGQTITAGQPVGTEGSTGASTGPHVHFEVRLNNTPVNPRNYLTGNP
jgi:murein DD-endopeptidase MepM/ murein hydrolase activator NlpD